MRRSLGLILITLSLLACDAFKNVLAPSPGHFEHHEHDLILYVSTVNGDSNALHLTRARFPVPRYVYQRPASGPHEAVAFQTWFPETLWIDVLGARESTEVLRTTILHYVEYQREFGGDTMRFSELDTYAGWQFRLLSGDEPIVRDSVDSLIRIGDLPTGLPDTVRGGGPLEIDVTFDLDGLFSLGPGNGQILVNPAKVEYRQR